MSMKWLGRALVRDFAMKSPLLIALIAAIVIGAGGGLAAMNNACKKSHHPWCASIMATIAEGLMNAPIPPASVMMSTIRRVSSHLPGCAFEAPAYLGCRGDGDVRRGYQWLPRLTADQSAARGVVFY